MNIRLSNEVITSIEQHMSKYSRYYDEWYVGITNNPERRMFNEHNVYESEDRYICYDCEVHLTARSIEQYFLDKGCKGGHGGGDETSTFVYAYKIKNHTQE